jgi:hypothetical protein
LGADSVAVGRRFSGAGASLNSMTSAPAGSCYLSAIVL